MSQRIYFLPILFVIIIVLALSTVTVDASPSSVRSVPIVVDHRHTDISQIPEYWINRAKELLRLSYGHTSHGSQLVTGLGAIKNVNPLLYDYNTNGVIATGILSLRDTTPVGDLGNPDRVTWAALTRTYLNGPTGTGPTRNVVMWSWCGQVSSSTSTDINTYLNLMNQLETDYPTRDFVYMTGHLDGTGEAGTLKIRNQQIRAYAIANNKVLFDFADIESYDPAGNYYPNESDGCSWCTTWCASHPADCVNAPPTADCAHSHGFNCLRKGQAFWWLMARLAGWPGPSTTPVTISGNAGAGGAALSYTDVTPKNATADSGGIYSFTVPSGWSGTVTPSKTGYRFSPASISYTNVTTNQTAQNYTAMLKTYSLTVIKVGAGGGTVTSSPAGINCGGDCSEIYGHGTNVTLTATRSAGSMFDGWGGACSGTGSCVVSMTAAKSVTATFTLKSFLDMSRWSTGFGLANGWTVQDYVRKVGDVNDDDQADLIGFGLDGVYVALSTGTGFGAPTKWSNGFGLANGWTVQSFVRTVGDVTGDGKADLVGFGADGVYVATSTGTGFGDPTRRSTGFGLANGWTVQDYVRTVGDVNNDNRADLIGFGYDGVYVALAPSTGTAFGPATRWSTGFDLSHGWTVSGFVRTVGDVNNDRRADLIGFGQDGVYVALSTGTGFGAVSKWTSAFDLSHGWTVQDHVRTVGDVNNDQRADLIGFGQDGVYVALSTGTGFGAISRWTDDFDLSHGWTVQDFVRTVGDVNNDLKADLVGFGLDGVYVGIAR